MSKKIFYDNLISYLRQNDGCWENVYLISSILHDDENFEYRYSLDDDDNINGFIGMWQDEKAVTMTGNIDYCVDFFEKNMESYTYYDINPKLSSKLIGKISKNDKSMKATEYCVMNMDTTQYTYEENSNKLEKISRDTWEVIRKEYKEKYQIDFSGYCDEKMEWYVSKDEKGKVVSNLCFEKVMEDMYILSNFYSSPEVKGKGYGRELFRRLIGKYNRKLVLFVKKDHPIADFYEEIGFNRVASTWSFGI